MQIIIKWFLKYTYGTFFQSPFMMVKTGVYKYAAFLNLEYNRKKTGK